MGAEAGKATAPSGVQDPGWVEGMVGRGLDSLYVERDREVTSNGDPCEQPELSSPEGRKRHLRLWLLEAVSHVLPWQRAYGLFSLTCRRVAVAMSWWAPSGACFSWASSHSAPDFHLPHIRPARLSSQTFTECLA